MCYPAIGGGGGGLRVCVCVSVAYVCNYITAMPWSAKSSCLLATMLSVHFPGIGRVWALIPELTPGAESVTPQMAVFT